MSHNDEHRIFESVIRLTGERDKNSLTSLLVKALADFVDFDAIIFLRLHRSDDSDYMETVVSVPKDAYRHKLTLIPYEYGDRRVLLDDTITKCMDDHEVISTGLKGIRRTLFPIIVNHIAIGVLDLYGYHRTENTDKLIDSFIRIYSNFITIIDDSEHDTLTGLLNRKTFDARLSELLVEANKSDTFSFGEKERRTVKKDTYHWVGILDIDHFKNINDNFGHVYGDEVLLLFANLMKKTFRSDDLLFRYGGEEFVVVLAPDTELGAFAGFERFRQQLEIVRFPQVGHVSVSIGMVKIDEQSHSITVLENADQALYYAKEHGRNRTCNYHKLIRDGILKARYVENEVELF